LRENKSGNNNKCLRVVVVGRASFFDIGGSRTNKENIEKTMFYYCL